MVANDGESGASPAAARRALSTLMNHTIERIKLRNFMSYDDVEIFPGPGLNLVIGPNGSGKSTLVCAIALGLGGDPSLLSRAQYLSGFVKHHDDGSTQAKTAEIEIELKVSSADNIVIKRVLHRTDASATAGGKRASKSARNHSEEYWNGKEISCEELKERLSRLNIRIDNMCQFLPQDKVSMFSRLNEQELLEETIRAGLGENMVTEKKNIHAMQQQVQNMANTAENERIELEQKEQELQGLESAVDAFHKLEKYKTDLYHHEAKIDYITFTEARDNYKKANDQLKELSRRRNELATSTEEAGRALARIVEDARAAGCGNVGDGSGSRTLRNANVCVVKLNKEVEKYGNKANSASDEIRDLVTAQKTQQRKAREARNNLEEVEAALEKWQDENDLAALKEAQTQARFRLDQSRKDSQALRTEHSQAMSDREQILDEIKSHKHTETRIKQQMEAEEGVLRRMGKIDRSSAEKGWRVIQESIKAGKLQGNVYLPAMCLKPKSTEVAAHIEREVNQKHLTTLVSSTLSDEKLLMSVSGLDCLMLSLNRRAPQNRADQNFLNDIAALGYMDELIEAPREVIDGLRDIAGIDKVIVGSKDTEELMLKMDEARMKQMLAGSRVVTPHAQWSFRRSKYGAREVSISTKRYRNFPKPEFLGASARNEELENRMRTCQSKLRIAEARVAEFDGTIASVEPKLREFKMEEAAFRLEQDQAAAKIKAYTVLLATQQKHKAALAQAERKGQADPTKDLQMHVREVTSACTAISGAIKSNVDAICAGASALSTQAGKIMRNAALNAKRVVAEQAYQARHSELGVMTDNLRRHADRTGELKAAAKKYKVRFNDRYKKDINELSTAFTTMSSSLDDLRAEAKLLAHRIDQAPADETALQRYEDLKHDVETLRNNVQNRQDANETTRQELEEKLKNWTTKVRKLVNKVSSNFMRSFDLVREKGYECSGEVALEMVAGDISKCGVVIKVSFRKDHPLRRLDVRVQSGGERSLSTFMYLLALNEVSQVPFRVVDEINQGMDEDKERISMQRLFDSSIGPASGQYFLITPKLLAGMAYHDNITFHVIFNGEGAPPAPQMNMANFLDAARAARAARAPKRAPPAVEGGSGSKRPRTVRV